MKKQCDETFKNLEKKIFSIYFVLIILKNNRKKKFKKITNKIKNVKNTPKVNVN